MMKKIIAVLLLVGICAAEYSAKDSQTDYENSICECVPYYQCNMQGLMNDDGEGIIDIRNGFVGTVDNPQSDRKPCDHYLSVCCLKGELTPGKDVSPVEPPTGGHGDEKKPSTKEHGGKKEPSTGGHGSGHPKVKPLISKGCGYRNINGVGFRISGNFNNEANFAEFPWMVAILKKGKVGGHVNKVYQCGGSLIHPRAILTAAHCIFGKPTSELIVRAGEWDTQTLSEALPYQDRDVSNIIPHPKYNYKNLHNDFALLILNKPFDLADNVDTVCLPEKDEYFYNSNCFATGWGKNEFGDKGKYQVILKAVELPTVAHDKCQHSLRQTRLGRYFKLDQSFMCAGGVHGIDTCTGDGGSPLVCPLAHDPTRYTQAGIVAWGIGCGKDGVPGVYGDVTKARPWIDEQLASYNIDSTSYTPGANNHHPAGHGIGSPVSQPHQVSGSPGYKPNQGSGSSNHGANVPVKSPSHGIESNVGIPHAPGYSDYPSPNHGANVPVKPPSHGAGSKVEKPSYGSGSSDYHSPNHGVNVPVKPHSHGAGSNVVKPGYGSKPQFGKPSYG